MNYKSHDILKVQVHTMFLENINNIKLLEEISKTENKIPSNLVNGFGQETNHTYYEDSSYPWEKDESKILLKEIDKAVSHIVNKEMKISEAWTLTLFQGQSVMAHSHRANWHMFPEDYYSIAYYANAPSGSAKLLFEIGHSNISESIYEFEPEPGMLVVFNSFVKHMTTRHNSEEPRVTISANLIPINQRRDVLPDLSGYFAD